MQVSKPVYALSLVVVLVVGLAAGYVAHQPTETKALRHINFMLDWVIGGIHSPYYVALDKGYYAKNGLEVTIIAGSGTNRGISALISNTVDFAFLDGLSTSVAMARDSSLHLKEVAMVYERAPFVTFYLKNHGINSPKDLAGKTVGLVPGSGLDDETPVFLNAVGVNPDSVKILSVDAAVKNSLFVAGKFDFTVGYAYQYPLFKVNAEKAGNDVGFFSWAEYVQSGLAYANGIVTTDDMIQKEPDVVKAFVEGTTQGWIYALQHQSEASQILVKYNPQLDANVELQSLKYILPFVFTPEVYKDGFGSMTTSGWQTTVAWSQQYLKVTNPRPIADLYTNSFISKTIPPQANLGSS